jgi:hypothetical protein
MYASWKVDKSSVHLSWQLYFENPVNTTFQAPPTLFPASNLPVSPASEPQGSQAPAEINDHMKVLDLILTYLGATISSSLSGIPSSFLIFRFEAMK